MGKIFYLIGKSCTGKNTIYERLLQDSGLTLCRYLIYTTRPAREGEKEGREYYFVRQEKLEELNRLGCVIEKRDYPSVHGIWTYFTAEEGQTDLAKHSYLGIGTLDSYRKLSDFYGSDHICPVYVEVENGERLSRALEREKRRSSPDYSEMCRRYLADEKDFCEENIRKAGITKRFFNENLDECTKIISSYIKKQLS